MEPPPGWDVQLRQSSTHRLSQLVRQTDHFVQAVRQRWAAGQFVPSWCTVAWIDDLAGQVVRAEERLVDRGPPGRNGPPPGRRTASPTAPDAVPAQAKAVEQRQIAAIREAVRHAKEWEFAAHERAAEFHERAAEIQDRLGHQDRADQARQYAAVARDRLLAASAEQVAWKATLESFDR